MNEPRPTPESQGDDAWLAGLIRQSQSTASGQGATDGEAFTARVMEALPVPVATIHRRIRLRRTALILGAGLLGCGVAAFAGRPSLADGLGGGISSLTTALDALGGSNPAGLLTLAAVSIVVSLVLVSGGSRRRLI